MRHVSPETRAMMAWAKAIQRREQARRAMRRAQTPEGRQAAAAQLASAEAAVSQKRQAVRARISA